MTKNPQENAYSLAQCGQYFDAALARLAQARAIDPSASIAEVLQAGGAVLVLEGGPQALYERVAQIEAAGVFAGTDWAKPQILQAGLAVRSLRHGTLDTTVIEALSELRLLAVAIGDYFHPGITSERARNFITQVMALNLDLLSGTMSEADRERKHGLGQAVAALYQFQLDHMGYESILDSLVNEVWRILAQRPVQVDSARKMVVQIATCLYDPTHVPDAQTDASADNDRAARLVKCLYGPTPGCAEDPGLEVYSQRLAAMDHAALASEAFGFAAAMDDTGLVSEYHAVLLRHLRALDAEFGDALIPSALGLSSTGHDALMCYRELCYALIDEAIFPETSQAIYGLARLLERGALFSPPVAKSLWRQIHLPLSAETQANIGSVFGNALAPRVFLLADVLNLVGQPLGVGQGNNPTCQSVIGLSMWADNDPAYLLQLLAWAARDNEILMRFEGASVSSKDLAHGLAKAPPLDVDAVSLVLVPHLDRIYIEMGRLCGERDDDLHRWINPEFYGWWVGQGFRVVVDIHTEALDDYEGFVRHFYASYHPYYNGDIPVIHPQPAGIAVTDSAARYVGRHAISILRIALDANHVMRVYFYNPNNDSRQDWGQGIKCTVRGQGERQGEASLAFDEFASRMFVFHYDPLERGDPGAVPDDEIARVIALGKGSWAKAL